MYLFGGGVRLPNNTYEECGDVWKFAYGTQAWISLGGNCDESLPIYPSSLSSPPLSLSLSLSLSLALSHPLHAVSVSICFVRLSVFFHSERYSGRGKKVPLPPSFETIDISEFIDRYI